MNFSDLDFKLGQINPSGISDIGFFIPKSDIASWPAIEDDLDDEAATAATIAGYTGDFVLEATKTWKRIYSTQGKGKVTSEVTGETDCKMFVNKAELHYPKSTAEVRAFAKAACNGDFVFVIKHDGKWYVVGHKDYRTVVTRISIQGMLQARPKALPFPSSARCDTMPDTRWAGSFGRSFDCERMCLLPQFGGYLLLL
jgi:hypothetical protein